MYSSNTRQTSIPQRIHEVLKMLESLQGFQKFLRMCLIWKLTIQQRHNSLFIYLCLDLSALRSLLVVLLDKYVWASGASLPIINEMKYAANLHKTPHYHNHQQQQQQQFIDIVVCFSHLPNSTTTKPIQSIQQNKCVVRQNAASRASLCGDFAWYASIRRDTHAVRKAERSDKPKRTIIAHIACVLVLVRPLRRVIPFIESETGRSAATRRATSLYTTQEKWRRVLLLAELSERIEAWSTVRNPCAQFRSKCAADK